MRQDYTLLMSIFKTRATKRKITLRHLHNWNLGLAALHAAQGLAVLILSKAQTLPVLTSYLDIDPLNTRAGGEPVLVPATTSIGEINLAHLVVAFFFMSAIAHLVIATVYRKRYEKDLEKGINRARWVEYSLSASTMMVAIGLLVGLYDLSSMVMIFVLTAVMNLLGLVMEVHNQTTKKTSWLSFWIGTLAGIVPWIVIGIYLISGAVNGATAPTFVYWIFVSIFIFFSSFAVNMVLQYKKVGKWKDYIYGERVYMILSLVAKTLLAWQVFAGTLRP